MLWQNYRCEKKQFMFCRSPLPAQLCRYLSKLATYNHSTNHSFERTAFYIFLFAQLCSCNVHFLSFRTLVIVIFGHWLNVNPVTVKVALVQEQSLRFCFRAHSIFFGRLPPPPPSLVQNNSQLSKALKDTRTRHKTVVNLA